MKKLQFFSILFIFIFVCSHRASAQDMDFKSILTQVLQNNPSLQSSRHELDALIERYPIALAGWRPDISANASIYHSDIENSNFTGARGATTKDFGIDIEQPIYKSGRTTAEINEAKNLIYAGFMSAKSLQQQIILETIQSQINIRRSFELLGVEQKNVSLISDELNAVIARHKGGELTKTDVDQASTRLAGARSSLLIAEAEYNNARTEFERLVGIYVANPYSFDHDFGTMPSDINAALEQAMSNNPQVLAAEYAYKSANNAKDASVRSLFPTLFAFASYNRQFDPQPGIVDESEDKTIGMRLSVPIYQGGAARAFARQNRYESYARKTDTDRIKRDIKNDFILAWRRYQTYAAETNLRQDQVKSSHLAKKGGSIAAKTGERSILDVLDAEQEYNLAHRAMIESYYKYLGAKAEVRMIMGDLTPAFFGVDNPLSDPDNLIVQAGRRILSVSVD